MSRMSILVLAVLVSVSACSESGPDLPDLEFSQFGNPAESLYCLPYPVGETATVNQSYSSQSSHRGRFAYDFAMPFGSRITAARDGTVLEIKDQFADDEAVGGHENGAYIGHNDGTMAAYLHFSEEGMLVGVGDEVAAGQVIGLVGTSGTSKDNPHLHFEVFEHVDHPYWYQTLPVNFRNASGPLDTSDGLLIDTSYEALECPTGS
jgi:murein DD-endopeptidase MepM/ murein hydrolase activator NlpD